MLGTLGKSMYDEAYEEGVRESLLELGIEKFGSPPETIQEVIRSTEDIKKLRLLTRRVLTASSWAELLETP